MQACCHTYAHKHRQRQRHARTHRHRHPPTHERMHACTHTRTHTTHTELCTFYWSVRVIVRCHNFFSKVTKHSELCIITTLLKHTPLLYRYTWMACSYLFNNVGNDSYLALQDTFSLWSANSGKAYDLPISMG